jgi:hypothetical protein
MSSLSALLRTSKFLNRTLARYRSSTSSMMSRSLVAGAGPFATVFSGRMAQLHALACSPWS